MAATTTEASCTMQQHDITLPNELLSILSSRPDNIFKADRSTWWRSDIHVQTQVLSTENDSYQDGDVRAMVFHVKVAKNFKLECEWNLRGTLLDTKGNFLLRRYVLVRTDGCETFNTSATSCLGIEQCPHSFDASMIDHCEVYVEKRGWTRLTAPSEINFLLKCAAQLWHELSPDSVPRSACELRRQHFESGNDDLFRSGNLGLFQTLVKTENPPIEERIEKWLNRLPDHRRFNKIAKWDSDFVMGSYRNWEMEPDSEKLDWQDIFESSLLQQNLEADPQPKRDLTPRELEGGFMVYEKPANPEVAVVLIKRSEEEQKICIETGNFRNMTAVWREEGAVDTIRYVPRMMLKSRSGQYLHDSLVAIDSGMDLKLAMDERKDTCGYAADGQYAIDSGLIVFRGATDLSILREYDKLLGIDLLKCRVALRYEENLPYAEAFSAPDGYKYYLEVIRRVSHNARCRGEPDCHGPSPETAAELIGQVEPQLTHDSRLERLSGQSMLLRARNQNGNRASAGR